MRNLFNLNAAHSHQDIRQPASVASGLSDQALPEKNGTRFNVEESALALLLPQCERESAQTAEVLDGLCKAIASLDYVPMNDHACHAVAIGLADLIDYARLAGIRVIPMRISYAAHLLEYRVPQCFALDLIAHFDNAQAVKSFSAALALGSAWIMPTGKYE
jgi:hypothetical protein